MITTITFRDSINNSTTLHIGDNPNRVPYGINILNSAVKEILPARHENSFDIIFSKGEILTVFHPYMVLTEKDNGQNKSSS